MSHTLLETPKTGFVGSRPILFSRGREGFIDDNMKWPALFLPKIKKGLILDVIEALSVGPYFNGNPLTGKLVSSGSVVLC